MLPSEGETGKQGSMQTNLKTSESGQQRWLKPTALALGLTLTVHTTPSVLHLILVRKKEF